MTAARPRQGAGPARAGGAARRRLWLRNIGAASCPCEMCWWQRYAAYRRRSPSRSLALLAGRLPDRGRCFVWLAALAIAASGAIGVYHAGVELDYFEGFTQCTATARGGSADGPARRRSSAAPMVRCDEVQWSFLGISMAGWNAILSLVCCVGDPMAEPQAPARGLTRPPGAPATRAPDVASMLRVDQAGEYGATRIYAGQLAVLGGRHPAAGLDRPHGRAGEGASAAISTRCWPSAASARPCSSRSGRSPATRSAPPPP